MSSQSPKDPYRYFRVEARELWDALQRGALDLEKGAPADGAVAELLRLAHTLKGAARVVRLSAVAELAHNLESELEPLRGQVQEMPAGTPGRLFILLDGINSKLTALDSPAEQVPGPAGAAQRAGMAPLLDPRHLAIVRLEVSELDEVMAGQREASARLTLLRQQAGGLTHARSLARSLVNAGAAGAQAWKAAALELEAWLVRFDRLSLITVDQAVHELELAHARVSRMRLASASALLGFLERSCRDAADALGKPIRFEAVGGENRLDAPVLLALQDAFQHVVRNAVVHGIEDVAERLQAGKPRSGKIRVELKLASGRAIIRCTDDGRGLDTDAIAAKAQGLGLLAAGSSLTTEQAAALLLRGGLSTSQQVTELAGRGLGLDVLRETVERLKGTLQLKSLPGLGLELLVDVPATLSAYEVLEVEAGGSSVLIPFAAVRSVRRVDPGDLSRTAEGETILFEDEALPLLPLDIYFSVNQRQPRVAVLLGTGAGLAALGVDRVLGVREAVVLPLPELTPLTDLALGACLDAAGDPCLVLDPETLVRAARERRNPGTGGLSTVADRLPVLVVDDSLTTRMLELSILQTAGYEVDLAASAEEGLASLRRRRYGLMLVDVEMPGMSGFELLELLKEDAALSGLPTILVSSCDSVEDKRRGLAAGARSYIVKGEFDQLQLLARIKELMR